jgi:hypothetical protein
VNDLAFGLELDSELIFGDEFKSHGACLVLCRDAQNERNDEMEDAGA